VNAGESGEERAMSTTLSEFLKDQAAIERAQVPERQRRRDEWVQAVERLLVQIEDWLRQADTEKVLQVERTEVERREQALGFYKAPGLVIRLRNRQITVLPHARNVLDYIEGGEIPGRRAQGRVDLSDGGERYILFRRLAERGESWWLLDEDAYRTRLLDREAFEWALLNLLQ
jgi:hypothetical protein